MKLNEIANVIFRSTIQEDVDNGVLKPVLKVSNLLPNFQITNADKLLVENKLDYIFIEQGDILIKRINPNSVYYYDKNNKAILGTNLVLIKIKNKFIKKIDPKFLAYYLNQKIFQLVDTERLNPILMVKKLNNLDIPNIDFEFQRDIGSVWYDSLKISHIKRQIIDKQFEYNMAILEEFLERNKGVKNEGKNN